MTGHMPEPIDAFETWLLRYVAEAVEAGEVPTNLLAKLRTGFEAARATPQGVAQSAAIRHIADLTGIFEEKAEERLAAIEAQPAVTRGLLMHRIAEGWMEGQRKA